MKTGDIVSGAALAGLGVFIIVEARGWEYLGPDGPGPGFFPLWYGIALLVLSLLLIGWSVRRDAAPESGARSPPRCGAAAAAGPIRLRRA